MKNYIKFLHTHRNVLPNSLNSSELIDPLNNPDLPSDILNYYNSSLETKLPEEVDQRRVLIFDSNFECGNMSQVCITGPNKYNIFLNDDTNSRNYCHWFYFAATNVEPEQTVTFNILNCSRWISLYKLGMKPVVFSEIDFACKGITWVPDTFNVSYSRTSVPRQNESNSEGTTYSYTLSFCYIFKNKNDKVYFAASKPYSYTMLTKLLNNIKEHLLPQAKSTIIIEKGELCKEIDEFTKEEDKKANTFKLLSTIKRTNTQERSLINNIEKNKEHILNKDKDYEIITNELVFRKETLTYTLGDIPIDLITITAYSNLPHAVKKRKVVFITARVHAAEVASSFKMEGILRFLTGDTKAAKHLRSLYIFKIVPMLNPDGVICGNFRCNLMGVDLNRCWDSPDKVLHSQIYYLKNLIRKTIADKYKIMLFCDLHEHSRSLNSFIYGCNKLANGSFCTWTKVRLLPRIMAKNCELFSYNDCRFSVESSKRRTARVVIWKELKVDNSFTLESSCYGYMKGKEIKAFGSEKYYVIGEEFLKALLEYYYVVKNMEEELVLTKGWLKPSKLIELTGTPAAVLAAKKIAKEKEMQQKKIRTEKIKEILSLRSADISISLKQMKSNGKLKQEQTKPETTSMQPEEEWEKVLKTFNLNKQAKQSHKFKRRNKATKSVNKRTISQSKAISNDNATTLPSIFRKPMRECINLYDKNDVSSEEEPVNEKKLWENYFTKEEIESVYNNVANPEYEPDASSEESEEVPSVKSPESILNPTIKKTLKPLRISVKMSSGIVQPSSRQQERSSRKYIQMCNVLSKRSNRQPVTKSNIIVSCKPTFRNNKMCIENRIRNSVSIKKEGMSPSMSLTQNEDKHAITINIKGFNFNGHNVSDKKSIGNEIYSNVNVITFMQDNEVYNKIIKSNNSKYIRKNLYNDKRNAIESMIMNIKGKDTSSVADNTYYTSYLNPNNN